MRRNNEHAYIDYCIAYLFFFPLVVYSSCLGHTSNFEWQHVVCHDVMLFLSFVLTFFFLLFNASIEFLVALHFYFIYIWDAVFSNICPRVCDQKLWNAWYATAIVIEFIAKNWSLLKIERVIIIFLLFFN